MRTPFLLALCLSLVLGVTYWYQRTAYICPVPLPYRLAALDAEFDLTPEEAQSYITVAETLWEAEAGRPLFVYDETAAFTINFLFDERQAFADSEELSRSGLDRLQQQNDELLASIEVMNATFAESQQAYETQVTAYEERLAAHNANVVQYNDRGGAPPDAFARLEAEQAALEAERLRLEGLTRELNQTARELNRLGEQANRQIDSYNRLVTDYNNRFADGREFTQGDFQGDQINIYKFSDDVELVTVLAHEFGHALGIDHVEGEESVMYYLMTERTKYPTLSAADRAALAAVCGTGSEWDHRLRRIIRSGLTWVPGS
jgi:hypothetical protein